MTDEGGPVRVVVAVSPQLLSDAVRRTLDLDGIATAELDTAVDPAGTPPVDVAIVSSGREQEVVARTVISLVGETPTVETVEAVRVTDLVQLRSALAVALPSSG